MVEGSKEKGGGAVEWNRVNWRGKEPRGKNAEWVKKNGFRKEGLLLPFCVK